MLVEILHLDRLVGERAAHEAKHKDREPDEAGRHLQRPQAGVNAKGLTGDVA